jgi:hypothetical protein
MAYIRGEAREQTTMFPVTLDELIPGNHMCRVIAAFVGRLKMAELGFVRPNRPRRDVQATICVICRSCICTGICGRCGRRGGCKPSASATKK